jgi:hypothetical protein
MNPKEAPKTAPSAGITGFRPAAAAIGITMGTTIVALAVLLVVSEMRMAMSAATAETARRLVTPRAPAMPLPRVSASPGVREHRPERDTRAGEDDGAPVYPGCLVPVEGEAPLGPVDGQDEKESRSADSDRSLVESAVYHAVDSRFVAEQEGDDSGEHPEANGDGEDDQRVALTPRDRVELAPLLVDVLPGARDPAHLRMVEEDQDYPQERKHGKTDRKRGQDLVEEGYPYIGLVFYKADTDKVWRGPDRREKSPHPRAVGDH